ncbi:MAG: hypothetical protein M1823_005757 [Watsoniomyces obsoletus]|nr:MAG: hypothetical protein M1823_005757 [Watsoniomyces obsoletus]
MRPQRPPSRRRPLHQRSDSETNEQAHSTIRLIYPSDDKDKVSRPPTSSTAYPIEDEATIVSDGVSAPSRWSVSKVRSRSASGPPGGILVDDTPGAHDRLEPDPGWSNQNNVTKEGGGSSEGDATRHIPDEQTHGVRFHHPDTTREREDGGVALRSTVIARPSSTVLDVIDHDANIAEISQRGSSLYSSDSRRTSFTDPLSGQMPSRRAARRSTASYSAFPPVSPPPTPLNFPPPVPYPRGGGGGSNGIANVRPGVRPLLAPRGPRPLQWRQSDTLPSSGTIPKVVHDDKVRQTPITTTQARWNGATDGRMIESREALRMNDLGERHARRTQMQTQMQTQRDSAVGRESPVIPERVGVAVTSSPDWSRTSPVETRRNSTIRVVSGPLGLEESTWPITAEVRQSPSAEMPLKRSKTAASARPPPTRGSIASNIFPEWARAYYARGARDSVFDTIESGGPSSPPSRQTHQRPDRKGKRRLSRVENLNIQDPPSNQQRNTFQLQRSHTFRRPATDEWSPHLAPDRTASRLSVWTAPRHG